MPAITRFDVGPRYSEYAIHAGTVYLSGQVPRSLDQPIEVQTQEVLDDVARWLDHAGSSKAHILSAQIFLADMADYAGMNAVWDAWVTPGHTPPRATVEAKLAQPDYRIEVVVTAAQIASAVSIAKTTLKDYLLFYEYAPDYLTRRGAFRETHLALGWAAQGRGELIMGGTINDPVEGAVFHFRTSSPQSIQAFVESDPYVSHGLVRRWWIQTWNTVIGNDALNPVRAP